MEQMASLEVAEARLLKNVKRLVSDGSLVLSEDIPSLEKGVDLLNRLRALVYEDINQVQHEALILRAVRLLEINEFVGKEVEWYWNPRQTGTAEEPDLCGKVASRIVVSAEVTASDRPVGTIDKRMGKTLEKLSKMPGRRLYFVRTGEMENRANTKVAKAGYGIEVRRV